AARAELQMPLTPESMRASLRQAFSWVGPFAASANDVRVLGDPGVNPGIGTMLRPIATPLTLGGFDASVISPLAEGFRDQGFLPVFAGSAQASPKPAWQDRAGAGGNPLRPGDPV